MKAKKGILILLLQGGIILAVLGAAGTVGFLEYRPSRGSATTVTTWCRIISPGWIRP